MVMDGWGGLEQEDQVERGREWGKGGNARKES